MKAPNSARVCILGHLPQKAAKRVLDTVLAENRMDQAPQMMFLNRCEQEGSLARCVHEGEDVATSPITRSFPLCMDNVPLLTTC